MTIRAALYSFLTGTAAISSQTSTRVYPLGESPASIAYPYITFQKLANDHVRHMLAGAGLTAARYQLDVWARSDDEADAVAEAIRENLDNFRGTLGSVNTVEVAASFLENDEDDFAPPIDGSKVGKHRVRMEFVFWHAESVTPV